MAQVAQLNLLLPGSAGRTYCFSLAVRASPLAYRARKGAEAAAREAMRVAIALGVLVSLTGCAPAPPSIQIPASEEIAT